MGRKKEQLPQMIQERCVDQLTQILLNVTQEQTRFSHQKPRWFWRARLREESAVLSGYMAPHSQGQCARLTYIEFQHTDKMTPLVQRDS